MGSLMFTYNGQKDLENIRISLIPEMVKEKCHFHFYKKKQRMSFSCYNDCGFILFLLDGHNWDIDQLVRKNLKYVII